MALAKMQTGITITRNHSDRNDTDRNLRFTQKLPAGEKLSRQANDVGRVNIPRKCFDRTELTVYNISIMQILTGSQGITIQHPRY